MYTPARIPHHLPSSFFVREQYNTINHNNNKCDKSGMNIQPSMAAVTVLYYFRQKNRVSPVDTIHSYIATHTRKGFCQLTTWPDSLSWHVKRNCNKQYGSILSCFGKHTRNNCRRRRSGKLVAAGNIRRRNKSIQWQLNDTPMLGLIVW